MGRRSPWLWSPPALPPNPRACQSPSQASTHLPPRLTELDSLKTGNTRETNRARPGPGRFTQPAEPWPAAAPGPPRGHHRSSPGPQSTLRPAGAAGPQLQFPPGGNAGGPGAHMGPWGRRSEEAPASQGIGAAGGRGQAPAPALSPQVGPCPPAHRTAWPAQGVTQPRPLARDRVTCFSGKFQTRCSSLHLLPRALLPSPRF